MATKGRLAVSLLTVALASGVLVAQVRPASPQGLMAIKANESQRAQFAVNSLVGMSAQMGLSNQNSFLQRPAFTDQLGQTHVRVQQLFQGVRVWGGDAVAHVDSEGAMLPPTTKALIPNINLNVTPSLSQAEALAITHWDLDPKGPYASKPTSELVIYPETVTTFLKPISHRVDADDNGQVNAMDVKRQIARNVLAYHTHAELENGAAETRHMDYMIDAHTGAIIKKWSSLETDGAGVGNSQYSGLVSIQTTATTGGFELRDSTRGIGGLFGNNVVTDMGTGTAGDGTVYANTTNTWGDGTQYVTGGPTNSPNGQTAAVDAAYGIQATWDMYKNALGRNGIDNLGTASYLRVHYDVSYDNAFWSDACFCMTFGDGSFFTSLTSVDVAGHEMSHGVCATSANLTYSGESGGLNESNSDIFGTMVEFYARGGSGTIIGNTGGNWTIGEQLSATPLRYMYKPSLDGLSPDAYDPSIGTLDVHYSSGPMNRCFYFLSQGATVSGDTSTAYLPSGMAGVGNDKAARIWYRALTVYLTSTSDYAAARAAAISAAQDLYGPASLEEQAVWNAFAGINVGSIWL